MIKQQWIEWTPITGLFCRYDYFSLSENLADHQVSIELVPTEDPNQKINLTFNWAMSFRKTAIPYTGNILGDNKKLSLEWTFFEIKNSEYIQQLSQESGGLYAKEDFTHFLIITTSSIIEIAALQFSAKHLTIKISKNKDNYEK